MSHPIKHLITVTKHRWLVLKFGTRLHIFWTALFHDMSKFSPTEFIRSARYYDGKKSPTIVEREYNDGISWICLHHALRNKHHFHAYIDYLKDGFIIAPINYRHSVEYVADIMSASTVYKKKYDIEIIYDYFNSHSEHYLMHPGNKEFIKWVLIRIKETNFKVKKRELKDEYEKIMAKYSPSYKIPYASNTFDILKEV